MANAIQSSQVQRLDAPVTDTKRAAAKLAYRKATDAVGSSKASPVSLSEKTISRFAFFRFRALGLAESRAISGSTMLASASESASAVAKVLDRLGSLSTQAERDGLSEPERTALRSQFQNLVGELRHSIRPSHEQPALLDGSARDISITVEDDQGEESEASPFEQSLDPDSDEGLALSDLSLDTPENARRAGEAITRARDLVERVRSTFDVTANGVENYAKRIQAEHQDQSETPIRDVASATSQSSYAYQLIVGQASEAVLAQSNASPARAYDVLVN